MSDIQAIAFFVFPVTDMARAREFYEQTLGLTKFEVMNDGHWIEYEIDGVTLSISDQLPGPPCTGGGVAFAVDDVEAAMGKVKAKGVVPIRDTYDGEKCRGSLFGDPDGNLMGFHQFK